ncbi:DUF222 domain-containing protein [Pseudonocardia nematodicida]|uniref:DUF222 domain-containing protein n=1 Tax=Pseudonocardia nematodicida TaxID=1206997 RepID=A0ABV1KFL6_9PSEU
MSTGPVATAHRLLTEAFAAMDEIRETGTDTDLLSLLPLCEGAIRKLDRITVATVSDLDRRGAFTDRGYRNPALALADLLNVDRADAKRRVRAAEHVHPRTQLDGTELPATLPATAERFADGRLSLRHVDVIATVLSSHAARRIDPARLEAAEQTIAEHACVYNPSELHSWATQLVEALDEDGPEPDDAPPPEINTVKVIPNRTGGGGRITGRYDDAVMFDAIATALDALSAPKDNLDDRSWDERTADALAEICSHTLDHGPTSLTPEVGGRRPVIHVVIGLADLQNRARGALLDFGGQCTPESLRMLTCDAAVVPIVMNGAGQPLDVGRVKRTIPDGIRRAVAVRDRGCAHPGCNRPPSWCEVHHINPWELDGETKLSNCVMLCKVHHRLLHHSAWTVRIRDGIPEFIPPKWIDPQQLPRRKPRPVDVA